ncbi:ParB-like nuclease [Desulfocapsa sulfexigens DSM 10523]|uniref:ParB-like nuclease n=1 Tax=Desulfocapsa sulfexigens (strain DSM 10523 / SB164P1) TaxID=1167006 RepID=M1PBV3_DESSD|nr:ParB N-terminal domain-containing protein [Desulfocapsa sulfexigens]AGF79112.1 ParB-like nuclease [Desulfocapsa sulfexigens DSM 10523]
MHPSATFHPIELNKIQISDEWSLHPFLSSKPPATALVESINRVGILRPPILLRQPKERYKLVCGKSRLETLKTNPGKKSPLCLILREDNSPKNILSYIVEDQSLSGNFSAMEKAYFFSHCLKYMDSKEAAALFFTILHQKIQPHTINKCLDLIELELDIQISIHNGIIGEKTAHELLKMSPEDRQLLHGIFIDLQLGGGKQKRLLSLCKDLAYREEKTLTELLMKPEFNEILTHPEMNQPQKATVLLACMQKMLFPQSISAEELFRKKVTTMNLPATCKVTHALSFETDAVSLIMDFKTLTELEKRVPEILHLAETRRN